jgi:hypothetical protein
LGKAQGGGGLDSNFLLSSDKRNSPSSQYRQRIIRQQNQLISFFFVKLRTASRSLALSEVTTVSKHCLSRQTRSWLSANCVLLLSPAHIGSLCSNLCGLLLETPHTNRAARPVVKSTSHSLTRCSGCKDAKWSPGLVLRCMACFAIMGR